jgi:23S rRNA (adenine2503-C2)-methyltransferase
MDTSDGSRAPDAHVGRHTVCLSSQAGCAMGCTFCATGQMGLVRDLSGGEVVEQAVYVARRLRSRRRRLSNAVFMGMGEPLANFAATWHAVECLTDPDGFGLGARRITVSTVGLPGGIDRLAASGKPVRLAVSLHAPDDALRSSLVAINETHGLPAVLAACRRYQAAGGRRITFEYVLIRGVNDRPEHARALARTIRGIVAHVNLIPLNPTHASDLLPSVRRDVVAFHDALEDMGVPATARMRRGIDIDAGCGQLRSRAAEGRLGRTVVDPRSPIAIPEGTHER